MKKRNLLFAAIIPVLALSVIAYKGYDTNAQSQTNQTVIYRDNVYDADVVKPEFLKNNSDIVVVGKITNKKAPAKANLSVGRKDEVVYTDTNVTVDTVVCNKSKKQINPGDTLTIRNLGGTAGDIKMVTDTEGVLKNDKNDKKVLLFLADISKDLSLPQSNVPTNTYAIVGGFHGSFSLSSDGIEATRDVTGDKFKTDDLEKLFLK